MRAIAQIIESPGGVIFELDANGNAFHPRAVWSQGALQQIALPPLAADADLARFLISRGWVIDIAEYQRNPAVYGGVHLPQWLLAPATPWRIVSPLLDTGKVIGFVALLAPPAPYQMTFEDRDLLRTAGRHIAVLLALQGAERRLTEGRQFDAFNRLAAFVMHDLKNSVAQLQLLVSNAARHRDNPEFVDDAISTIANTVERMTRLIGELVRAQRSRRPVRRSNSRCCCVGHRPGRSAATPCRNSRRLADGAGGSDPDPARGRLDHVIRNAQDAARQCRHRAADAGRGSRPHGCRDHR